MPAERPGLLIFDLEPVQRSKGKQLATSGQLRGESHTVCQVLESIVFVDEGPMRVFNQEYSSTG